MDPNDSAGRHYDIYTARATQQPSNQASQFSSSGSVADRFIQNSFLSQHSTSTALRTNSPGSTSRLGRTSSALNASSSTTHPKDGENSLYSFSTYPPIQSDHYSSALNATDTTRVASATQQQQPQQLLLPQPLPPSQQTQPYGSYASNVMYGMSSTQTPSAYDHVPQYRARPNAANESLTSQFPVSQNRCYLASQAPTTGAESSEFGGQHMAGQYQQSGYSEAAAPSTPSNYATTMLDPSQSATYSGYPHTSYGALQASQSIDQAFNDYQSRVRSIFTLVRDGSLRDIAVQLLNISHYLLGNAEALGLTRDDDALHDDRVRLWDEFNRTWLATLQRQFDLTTEIIQGIQAARDVQSIMTQQSLEYLSRELVRMCDSIEKHGLVDYQMGVAEEEIMDLLLRCLQLLDPVNDKASGAAVGNNTDDALRR